MPPSTKARRRGARRRARSAWPRTTSASRICWMRPTPATWSARERSSLRSWRRNSAGRCSGGFSGPAGSCRMPTRSSRYDVAVLGGGAAGCVLAARLSEDPDRRVCLVEAGPDYGHYDEGRWPEDILDARALALESHTWETALDDRSQLRARIVGGCSAHNACAVLRGASADYDEWGPGWTAAELEPYLDRGERALRTRTVGEDELSP